MSAVCQKQTFKRLALIKENPGTIARSFNMTSYLTEVRTYSSSSPPRSTTGQIHQNPRWLVLAI